MKQLIKPLFAGCFLLISAAGLRAQTFVHIGAGGQMFISSKAVIAFDSLLLMPTHGGFLLVGENDITKLSDPINPFTGVYLKRVYCFSHPVQNYDGSLTMLYNKNEAMNIDTNELAMNAFTGYDWHRLHLNNNKNNEVTAAGLYNLSFSELLTGYKPKKPSFNPDSKTVPIASLSKVDESVTVVLYPNPVSSLLNVSAGGNASIKRIKVFDASGKLVMVREGSNNNVYSFAVTHLAGGFYLMSIETNKGKFSKGFMKK